MLRRPESGKKTPMPFALVLGLLLPITSLWARQDRPVRLPSCAGELVALSDLSAPLPDNPHLLFRGTLTWFDDGRGRTWPAIRDREVDEKISPNPNHSRAFLKAGDELYVYDRETRRLLVEGRLGRDPDNGRLAVFRGERQVVAPKALAELVTGEAEAMVVRDASPSELADWRARLAPWLKRYQAHLSALDHSVAIGSRRVERAHFETLLEGKTEFKNEGSRLWIVNKSGRFELGPGDRLFLMDETGDVFYEGRIGNDPLAIKAELLRAKGATALTLPPF